MNSEEVPFSNDVPKHGETSSNSSAVLSSHGRVGLGSRVSDSTAEDSTAEDPPGSNEKVHHVWQRPF